MDEEGGRREPRTLRMSAARRVASSPRARSCESFPASCCMRPSIIFCSFFKRTGVNH